MSRKKQILQNIKDKTVTIGVLGLGYVGLPLAVTFADKHIHVIGFEKSPEKVKKLQKKENYIADVADSDLEKVIDTGFLTAATDFSQIRQCNAVIICVPTPLDRYKKPDMSWVEGACRDIGNNMKAGTFICLESTTFPTTTEDIVRTIIEDESGMVCGEDFWLAYSPERVDPGNKDFKTANTPKIMGALTDDGLEIGLALYGAAIEHLHPVSSPRVAEMVKILENTYRLVNISLINELALLAGGSDSVLLSVYRHVSGSF